LSVTAGLVFLFGNPVILLVALAIVLAVYTLMAGGHADLEALAVRRVTEGHAGRLPGPRLAG
jgi:uncharacterized membrane protein HdeD (DUF308 family)